MNDRRILVIAGSDSSGGAGLEADQKVIAAHGCYAMTATTALTAQNTQGVIDVHQVPAEFTAKQIAACVDDIGVDVVKTGMLTSKAIVEVVCDAVRKLQSFNNVPVVVDPVMVSTSGHRLLAEDAIVTLRDHLLPLATILTPNLAEAKLLCGHENEDDPETVEEMKDLAKILHKFCPNDILLKGGHVNLSTSSEAKSRSICDVFYDGTDFTIIEKAYLKSKNTHGTGCSLASAIASNIALGQDVKTAVLNASQYVHSGIATSISRGSGAGPINHFHSTYTLPFSPGHFVDWLLRRADVTKVWKAHVEHSFLQGIADGTLPMAQFKHYLIQDYLFLIQFARAKALAGSKSHDLDVIAGNAQQVLHVKTEVELHYSFCKEYGLLRGDLESTPEAQACVAYTRYVLDIGQTKDAFALEIAFAPCLIGYGMIARRLYDDPNTKREGNPYWRWIENYVAEDYTTAMASGRELLEKMAVRQSVFALEEAVKIFCQATRMETGFWDMGASVER